jgi:hypothetical protein
MALHSQPWLVDDPIWSSSQSNMRWAVSVRASGWQCSPAPSAAVNRTVVETFGVRAASCSACPGQNCSPSGLVMSRGVVICPATSAALQARTPLTVSA